MSFAEELNAHIGNEYAASQQYVAIAVYYDQETLPQLAAHFYRQAVEERNHAQMIVQYLLDADLPVTIPAVAEPRTTFTDSVAPVRLALEQEKQVTAQIAGSRRSHARRTTSSAPSSSTGSSRSSARRWRACPTCSRS